MKHRFLKSMKLVGIIGAFLSVYSGGSSAGEVVLTSSNLPIILIDTGGETIPDEPKITADMKIVYDPAGGRNDVAGPFDGYDGKIGIEVRGATSQMFPKKSYAVETRDENGEDLNVPLLGMPSENDWVLYGPYSDKTLIRNILAFKIANDMGRYATRTHCCELVLNGEYRGLYVLMEKIKRDKNRIDVSKLKPEEVSGDDLTGGYIVKLDKSAGAESEGWSSQYQSNGTYNFYQYHYPDEDDIVPQQQAYIRSVIDEFETVMMGDDCTHPVTGYAAFIDPDAFIDYLIVNEVSRNVDAYRLSTYIHKDKDSKDGRLKMGPVWDFNLAFGNIYFYDAWEVEGWQYDFSFEDNHQNPFWWKRLLADPAFQLRMVHRWNELRAGILKNDALNAFIDETVVNLTEARLRNFERWEILNKPIFGNKYVFGNYDDEVGYLKSWIADRLQWMDAQWPSPDIAPGNLDGLDGVTLRDAVIGLQVSAGMIPPEKIYLEADVDSDGRIGMADVMAILQQLAVPTGM